ncbi:meckelin [Acipenser ruthenus]|uniref:meckelin n=1 Tax=Acipenser ruthenus TaxID=7906 RepID=UPI002740E988|nr:meckelin [Acipenser ruthenus]
MGKRLDSLHIIHALKVFSVCVQGWIYCEGCGLAHSGVCCLYWHSFPRQKKMLKVPPWKCLYLHSRSDSSCALTHRRNLMQRISSGRPIVLQIPELLSQFPQPVFYELFLQYSDSQGNESLWPVPVMSSPGSSQVQQRFFLVDGLTGRQDNLNSKPQYVTYASKLVLSVYQPISSPGNDSPFKMTVQCTTVDNNREPSPGSMRCHLKYEPGLKENEYFYKLLWQY